MDRNEEKDEAKEANDSLELQLKVIDDMTLIFKDIKIKIIKQQQQNNINLLQIYNNLIELQSNLNQLKQNEKMKEKIINTVITRKRLQQRLIEQRFEERQFNSNNMNGNLEQNQTENKTETILPLENDTNFTEIHSDSSSERDLNEESSDSASIASDSATETEPRKSEGPTSEHISYFNHNAGPPTKRIPISFIDPESESESSDALRINDYKNRKSMNSRISSSGNETVWDGNSRFSEDEEEEAQQRQSVKSEEEEHQQQESTETQQTEPEQLDHEQQESKNDNMTTRTFTNTDNNNNNTNVIQSYAATNYHIFRKLQFMTDLGLVHNDQDNLNNNHLDKNMDRLRKSQNNIKNLRFPNNGRKMEILQMPILMKLCNLKNINQWKRMHQRRFEDLMKNISLEKCAICLEKYGNCKMITNVMVLSHCFHILHTLCYDQLWCKENIYCPICKTKIDSNISWIAQMDNTDLKIYLKNNTEITVLNEVIPSITTNNDNTNNSNDLSISIMETVISDINNVNDDYQRIIDFRLMPQNNIRSSTLSSTHTGSSPSNNHEFKEFIEIQNEIGNNTQQRTSRRRRRRRNRKRTLPNDTLTKSDNTNNGRKRIRRTSITNTNTTFSPTENRENSEINNNNNSEQRRNIRRNENDFNQQRFPDLPPTNNSPSTERNNGNDYNTSHLIDRFLRRENNNNYANDGNSSNTPPPPIYIYSSNTPPPRYIYSPNTPPPPEWKYMADKSDKYGGY